MITPVTESTSSLPSSFRQRAAANFDPVSVGCTLPCYDIEGFGRLETGGRCLRGACGGYADRV